MKKDTKESKVLKENEDGSVIRLPDTQEEFSIMERMADEAIVSKMNDKLLNAYVYQFTSPQGDLVVDLTKDGLFAFANLRKGIELRREYDNLDDKDAEDFMMIYSAKDLHTGDVREGSAQEAKVKGSRKDPYALAKCMSKSQRNALKNILSVDAWRQLILIFLEEQDKQKREMVLLSIHDNIEKFGYETESINGYCTEEYGIDVWDSLDTDSLTKLNSFMTGRRGRDKLKPDNDDKYLPEATEEPVVIETVAVKGSVTLEEAVKEKNIDKDKLEKFIKGRKNGRGSEELDSTEMTNLVKYIQLSSDDIIKKLQ